jgi:hypothetical protein
MTTRDTPVSRLAIALLACQGALEAIFIALWAVVRFRPGTKSA